MSTIKHCGQHRRAAVWWLVPTGSETKLYKHIVLMAITCPACNGFILEWYGINLENRKCGQHRIALKDHDEWIARTAENLDATMCYVKSPEQLNKAKQEMISKIKATRVQGSKTQFPWNFRMAIVR